MFSVRDAIQGIGEYLPSEGFSFAVREVPGSGGVRVGLSASGPALLVPSGLAGNQSRHVRLKHLEVLPSVRCRMLQDGEEHTGVFTVCRCVSSDGAIASIFVDALTWLVNAPDGLNRIPATIEALIELFAATARESRAPIVGVWGELFTIAVAHDPGRLIAAWHLEPGDAFDFSSDWWRLEVKTSADRRAHRFSLRQLEPPGGVSVAVASLVTSLDAGGVSVRDLMDRVVSRCSDGDQVGKVMSSVAGALGADVAAWDTVRFSLAHAVESLKLFDGAELPRPWVNDARVVDVRFTLDCTDTATRRPEGPLVEALGVTVG